MDETFTPRNGAVRPRFKGEILRQVYRVWLFRRLLPVLIGEVLALAVVLYLLGQAVFIQRVIENALVVFFSDPSSVLSFTVSAFANAPLLTKLLSFGFALLVALVLRHLTQGVLRLILVRENYFGRVSASPERP